MAILYLCDRKACENCSGICKHTTDIRHAVNFEQYHADGIETGDFWEKDLVSFSGTYPTLNYCDSKEADSAPIFLNQKL